MNSSPGDDELLVEVEAAVFGRPELAGSTGGSLVGTVTSTGRNATAELGARVIVGPIAPCGECDLCGRGAVQGCGAARYVSAFEQGSHRRLRQVVVPARWVCRLDDDLCIPGPSAALVGREAALAYAAYIRLNVAAGDPLVILGAGPIATILQAIAIAKSVRLLNPSLAIPTHEQLRQSAQAAGTNDIPWRIAETTGSEENRATAIELAGHGSTVALIAPSACGGSAAGQLQLGTALDRGVTICGIAAAHPDLYPEVAALAVRGELDLPGSCELQSSTDDLASAVDSAEQAGKALVLQFDQ